MIGILMNIFIGFYMLNKTQLISFMIVLKFVEFFKIGQIRE